MKIAVLGTGNVGKTIATKLVEEGFEVTIGSRTGDNPEATQWATANNSKNATFDEAAKNSEIIFNCTNGNHTLDALEMIDEQYLNGKICIDLANELEMVDHKPTSLASSSNSLARKIQQRYPNLSVVKTLNTVTASLMVNPSSLGQAHNIFVSGDDDKAKSTTIEILQKFGWNKSQIIDLGDISTAVGPEMYMGLWLNVFLSGQVAQSPVFNLGFQK